MYHYTLYGWYTSASIPGRETGIAPPTSSETTTPGAPRANWDGRAWGMQPYITEPAPAAVVPLAPTTVTMCQARLALLAAGKLSNVATALASLPSPQKEAAQIQWEFAADVHRTSVLTVMLAGALGLDSPALDAIFTAAAAL